MRLSSSFLLPLLCSIPSTHAWGEVGHKTVAAIAEYYLTPLARIYVSKILLPTETFVSVAKWADDYRYSPEGKFTRGYHFIDAEDTPPDYCNVTYKRDCHDNSCIVSAIKNYTTRIQTPTLPPTSTNEALKFLIHFLGDITQPLHTEHLAFGGNGINVTWDSQPKKLHGVWDSEMPDRIAGGNDTAAIVGLTAVLTAKIEAGVWPDKARWTECVDVGRPEECSLVWATDSNRLICEYVLKSKVEGQELNGTYFEGARPIIEVQIAKGGARLAAWINALAAEAAEREQDSLMEVEL